MNYINHRQTGFVLFSKSQYNYPTNTCQSPFVSIAESNTDPCLHLGNNRLEEKEIKINTITSCLKLLSSLKNIQCKNT